MWPLFSQHRSIWPEFGQLFVNTLARVAMLQLEYGPHFGFRSNFSSTLGQLCGNEWTIAGLTGIAGHKVSGRVASNSSATFGSLN